MQTLRFYLYLLRSNTFFVCVCLALVCIVIVESMLSLISGERNVKYKELKKREETMDGMYPDCTIVMKFKC